MTNAYVKPLKILTYLMLIPVMFSCVPRKKMIYLQKEKENISSVYYYDAAEYKLKPEDVFALEIFSLTPGEFNFFASGQEGGIGVNNLFTVRRDGIVELPAIGEVEMAGLTIGEAQAKIKGLLEDYLKSPLVKITLQTPFTYTILGEVNGEGRNTLLGEQLNILEAIANAGGLTTFADREKVRIVRKEGGKINILTVNLLEEELLGEAEYQIRSNDIILVDPLPARFWRENQLFGFTTLVGLFSTASFVIFRFTQ